MALALEILNLNVIIALLINKNMDNKKYICSVCDYIYDPALGDPSAGIPAGTPFSALPSDWLCPDCRAPKNAFRELVVDDSKTYQSVDDANLDEVLLA